MKQRTKGKAGCDGVALIVALFAVMILTALAVTFASVARSAVLLAGNRRAMLQAFYAAQSGLNYCRPVLAADDPGVDSAAEQWAQVQDNPPALDIPGFTVNVVIEDESARLDVNTATKSMLTSLGIPDETAQAIVDWREPANAPGAHVAESDYYLGLPSPYEAANADFQTIDELRLVRGVDQALFEGDGTDANPGLRNLLTVRSGESNRGRTDIASSTWQQVAAAIPNLTTSERTYLRSTWQRGAPRTLRALMSLTGVSFQKLARALDRFYATGRNSTASFAEGTVNLNTASAPVLQAIGLPAETAQAVIDQRATQAFTTKGELAERDLPGVTRDVMARVADRIATKSSVFRVRAQAQAEDRPLHAGVFALLDRSVGAPRLILWHEDFDPSTLPGTGLPPQSQEQ